MPGTTSGRSRLRRSLLIVAISACSAVVIVVAALLVANVVLLPRAVSRLEDAVAADGSRTLLVGGASYLPGRGITLTQVVLESGSSEDGSGIFPSVRFSVPVLRARVPPGLLGGQRALSQLGRAELRSASVFSDAFDLLGRLADARLLPRRVMLSGPAVTLTRPDGSSVTPGSHMVDLQHDRRTGRVFLHATDSPVTPVAMELVFGYAEREFSGTIEIPAMRLDADPILGGELGAKVDLQLADDTSLNLAGIVSFTDGLVDVPAIADEPVGDLNIRYEFQAVLDLGEKPGRSWPQAPQSSRILTNDSPWSPPATPPKGSLVFSSGSLTFNEIGLSATPAVYGVFEEPTLFTMEVRLPTTPVDRILRSVPEAAGGAVARTATLGTLEWKLSVWVPLDAVVDMVWRTEPALSGFAVREMDPEVNVYKLNGEFVHTIVDEAIGYSRTVRIPAALPASIEWMLEHSEHTRRQIERIRQEDQAIAATRPVVMERESPWAALAATGEVPAEDPSYRYVRVDDMSPWVVRSVLTAEDGDFFFYGGVNPVTLANAIALNLDAGEVKFGASTISMQLVKMLFLSQERVFSRKAQELFLVFLMEHQVPVSKERILELYINLAEFGPGVFGIYDAAQLYFQKLPHDLTVGEATWLASILPSPKTYFTEFQDGFVSNDSFGRMIALYNIMRERGRMTPAEHRLAVTRRPRFAPAR